MQKCLRLPLRRRVVAVRRARRRFPGSPRPPLLAAVHAPCLCSRRSRSSTTLDPMPPLSPASPPWLNGRRPAKLAQLAAPRHAILYAENPSPRPDPPDTARWPLPPSGRRWTATTVRRRRAYLNHPSPALSPHRPTVSLTHHPLSCTARRPEPLPGSHCCPWQCAATSPCRGRRRPRPRRAGLPFPSLWPLPASLRSPHSLTPCSPLFRAPEHRQEVAGARARSRGSSGARRRRTTPSQETQLGQELLPHRRRRSASSPPSLALSGEPIELLAAAGATAPPNLGRR